MYFGLGIHTCEGGGRFTDLEVIALNMTSYLIYMLLIITTNTRWRKVLRQFRGHSP